MKQKLFKSFGNTAALETIKFQSGVFFEELTGLFKQLRDEKNKEEKIYESKTIPSIEACVKHHTNLTIRFIVNEDGPMVMPPFVDKNHPFVDEDFRRFMSVGDIGQQLNKSNGFIRGTIDIAGSRVTGIFSEIVSDIHMPFGWLSGEYLEMTPEECAAAFLHEIGHLFTYYELLGRTTTTNQVLAAMGREYAKSTTVDERVVLLGYAHKALKLKEDDIVELAQTTNMDIVTSVLITKLAEQSRSEFGTNIYDMNSWECMSDNFAARHQAGRHLITALDKMHRDAKHMSYRSIGRYLYLEVMKVGLFLASFIPVPLASVIGFGLAGAMIMCDSDAVIYDEPEARFRRIKHQIIEALKNKNLDKKQIKQYQDDLEIIDNVMSSVKDKRQFLGIIADFVSPKMRKDRRSVVLQQELEKIANNALFEKAASFKVLSA